MPPKYNLLPEHIRDGVRLYIENGIEPGSFVTAVICNDLTAAFATADDINRGQLFAIVGFFYNEVPSKCWGSLAKMQAWMKQNSKAVA